MSHNNKIHKINKVEAQAFYDSGESIRKLAIRYNVSTFVIQCLNLKTRTTSEANQVRKENGWKFSPSALEKLSKIAKKNGLGGYRPHPNKGQRYKDIWFDSNWEVQVAKSLDFNNIRWHRPNVGFQWTDCGKKYYPDFFLPDYNVYLDPKNPYLQKIDEQKITEAQKRNSIKVFVLGENDLYWEKIKAIISQR